MDWAGWRKLHSFYRFLLTPSPWSLPLGIPSLVGGGRHVNRLLQKASNIMFRKKRRKHLMGVESGGARRSGKASWRRWQKHYMEV